MNVTAFAKKSIPLDKESGARRDWEELDYKFKTELVVRTDKLKREEVKIL